MCLSLFFMLSQCIMTCDIQSTNPLLLNGNFRISLKISEKKKKISAISQNEDKFFIFYLTPFAVLRVESTYKWQCKLPKTKNAYG